ncbi:membrane protein insertion efficiency factor YidD [Patescibacteria group bacterium]|nr:membrane protein insertion efficiency factor YidD [Patescibacteria group bacterium]
MNYLKKLKKIPANSVILIIKFYRVVFSPSVGMLRHLPFYPRSVCIFYPTCSEYGIQCFQKYSLIEAFMKTGSRIGRCHPGNEPKVDLP